MKPIIVVSLLLLLSTQAATQNLRPPAVPLIVTDPYNSIWSPFDNLYDGWTIQWAGGISALAGMIRVDGKCYRFMGPENMSGSVCPVNAQQLSVNVNATSTVYTFNAGGVNLQVKFLTPALMEDLKMLSMPITYIEYTVSSNDDKQHNVQVYYDNSAEVAINDPSDLVQWSKQDKNGATFVQIGTQNEFNQDNGSDRINWGKWSIAYNDQGMSSTVASDVLSRGSFAQNKASPDFDKNMPRKANDNWPVLSVVADFGIINQGQQQSKYFTVAYDQQYSMKYFGTLLKPYWTQHYQSIEDAQIAHLNEKFDIFIKCQQFDYYLSNLVLQSTTVNQNLYERLGSLVYRQVTGGLSVVWNHVKNETWVFMKEISSDGDVSTVDVIFPASPLILLLNPELFRLINLPLFAYGNNETAIYGQGINYNLAWAPHHLGQWPVSSIRPQDQEQMPVEETANMLILTAYIAQEQNNLDYLQPYWGLLKTWGEYLITVLPDPEDQLCTDDFEGPSPHNTNLAAKGIIGLGAYSILLSMKGDVSESQRYIQIAKNYSQSWVSQANDGDHFRLQYNLPGSWSQKYNIFFQEVLGLDIFDRQNVIEKENAFYQTKLNKYGVPLDNRASFTKLDWSFWIGAMSNDKQFGNIIKAIYDFANETQDRAPLTDWYQTDTGRLQGFRARPVLGGIFSRVLLKKAQNRLQSSQEQQLINKFLQK